MSLTEKKKFPKHKHRLCNRLTFSSGLLKQKYVAKKKQVIKILKNKKINFFQLLGLDKFIIENHRGAGIYEYENTLKAVRKAIDLGSSHIEIDVKQK